jgi:16S rRNA processing protein RimM
MDKEPIVVAEIVRARGNRGEVVVNSHTDVPKRLETLKQAQARLVNGRDIPIEIEGSWMHKGQWVLKLRGVNSIGEAERFRGADIWVNRQERGELANGEYFQADLIGCRLVDADSGTNLGVIEGWQQYGGPSLMEVRNDQKQALVPFVSEICQRVDLASRSIAVKLPEGLLEL